MTAENTHRSIDAVWRIEAARIIAGLARLVNDVGLAEELAQDALVAALEQWPVEGVPRNPGAWLMAVGRRRAIDLIRRQETLQRKLPLLVLTETADEPAPAEIEDDLLRLVFISCHPLLPTDSRVALTLRVLGGLTTGEIARAFLTSEPTVAQRIVRAKRALSEADVPFEAPDDADRDARLSSVLEVIYLIFNEGYSATAGDDLLRPALCDEALRLGRILAQLMPHEAEVHGLVGLMEIQASRTAARVDAAGEPILLLDQDRHRWDQVLIRRGFAAIERAEALIGETPGPYALQAAIVACHAQARTAADTNWPRIAALYGVLAEVAPSPIVELNRGVAVGMAHGPAAGLAIIDQLIDLPALKDYHLLPSVRGDLLARLGRRAEARGEFTRAAAITRNTRERALLQARAAALADVR